MHLNSLATALDGRATRIVDILSRWLDAVPKPRRLAQRLNEELISSRTARPCATAANRSALPLLDWEGLAQGGYVDSDVQEALRLT